MKFDESLEKLEEISEKLEQDNVKLEEVSLLFDEALNIVQNCYKTLKDAKGKVEIMREDMTKIIKDDI